MSQPKFGQVREDGKIFRGYQRRGDKTYEQWCSPDVFARRRTATAKHGAELYRTIKADPEKRAEHLAEWAIHAKRWRRNNPEKVMFQRARIRAIEKGLPFSIALGDVVIPDRCPIFGFELRVADGKPDNQSPELDRIRPELGYVSGNVIVISRLANRIKTDATPEQLLAVANFYLKLST